MGNVISNINNKTQNGNNEENVDDFINKIDEVASHYILTQDKSNI